MLSTCQQSSRTKKNLSRGSAPQRHRRKSRADTHASAEKKRRKIQGKWQEKRRGKSGIPAIMLSMCCYFAFLARISLDPKSEWDLSPNNRWTKILECVWNCIKKSFSFCGGFHGVFTGFPWFSQLLHGSAGLIQMNYLSQNVSVVAFFWVCGLNSISLANEFDYYT